jgi:hypothetical protein
MNVQKASILWFSAALMFFIAAMIRSERAAVFIPVGVVFLILSINSSRDRSRAFPSRRA